MKIRPFVAAFFSAGLFVSAAPATLLLAPLFTDHAVLQRGVSVPVWGWDGPANATMTVSFGGQTKETRVNRSGLWRVNLDPMPGQAGGRDLVVKGSTTITLHDVVVGEVWLASGQSNMEFPLSQARDYAAELARPADPLVRELHVDHSPADLPVPNVATSGWHRAAPGTIGGESAVGYYFARQLSARFQLPVGIIRSSFGGTPIESWLPEPVLRASSTWPRFEAEWQTALKVFPQKYAEQPALEAAWNKAQADFKATGKPITMAWPPPPAGPGSPYGPGTLFNGMVVPLVPYALRGVLWYQGESNVGHASEYAELLPALIAAWRAAWPLGNFPFLIVQLPNFSDNQPDGRAWAQLREAQASALRVPCTGLAVTIDGDEPDNLHPTNKAPVGDRLARLALAQVYGVVGVESCGPTFASLSQAGAALQLHFTHADGLKSTAATVTGFEIAGVDRVFHSATARIEGTTIVVNSPAVTEPVAVRYAYTNAPAACLVNAAGLPAAPFRTDDW
jgi:sialate O-acetylesterase